MHPKGEVISLRRLLHLVTLVALLLSGSLLPAATMPCCTGASVSAEMPSQMQMPAAPTANACHDAAPAMLTQGSDLIGCEHVQCKPPSSRDWKPEQAEAGMQPILSPLPQAIWMAQTSSSRAQGAGQSIAADPGRSTSLPMRV